MTMDDSTPAAVAISSGLREELERKEIEATGCRPSNEIYAKLLAVYLYENDLCSAKFLWKRIPEQAKNECVNLSQIWEVGKAMWNSNLSEVFRLIDTYEWSEHESDLMKAVKETVRERSFELIGRAYTSISVSEFSKYIGMTEEDAVSMALKEPGWTVNHQEKLICPVRRQQTELTTVQAEQQLTTLTNFVSFLEK